MMPTEIIIKGDLAEGAEKLERALKIQFQRSGLRMVNEVKLLMTTSPATGREYRVPGTTTRVHQASAPGEPPAVMLDGLRNNVVMDVPKIDGKLKLLVGVREAYADIARALEFGRRDGSIEPRPAFKPAFDNELPKLANRLRGERRET